MLANLKLLFVKNLIKVEDIKTKNIAIMLNEVSDGIKKVAGIKEFDNTKPLIDASDKLPADIIVKDILIVITCAIKDNNK